MNLSYKQKFALSYTLALFLDRMDLTIVNILLPTLTRQFHVSLSSISWISLSFLLALAVSIPISNWLGQRFGFKKIYVIAISLFGLGSILCAFAPNLMILILLRFIQGIGGGLLIPVGMTMLYRLYDKSEYASITSFTFLPSLIAPAIAPLLGGILLDTLGWRYVFLFSGPICIFLLIFSLTILKEEPHRSRYPLDKPGLILAVALLTDLFYSLSFLSLWGSLLFVPLLILFIWAELRSPHPLINLNFFKHRSFVMANLIQLCFQICHFGAIFLIGMFLQIGMGFTATAAGAMMGIQAISAMAISRYSVRLFNRHGAKLPISIGLLGIAFISPCIMLIDRPQLLMAGLTLFFIRGLFSGLCGTPLQTLGVIGFSKDEISGVSTVFNASRQVSISCGVAISSLLIALGFHFAGLVSTGTLSQQAAFQVFGPGFWALTLFALIGALLTQRVKQEDY